MKKHISIIIAVMVFVTVFTKCMQKNSTEVIENTSAQTVLSTQGKEESATETSTTVPTTDMDETTSESKTEKETTTAKTSTTKSNTTTTKRTTTTTQKATTTKKVTTTQKPTTTKKVTTTKPTTIKATTTKHTHTMPCGNVGKWYSSKESFMSDYNAKVDYWNAKLENGEISYEECASNVPRGYEVWQCSCGKWTGNHKYK